MAADGSDRNEAYFPGHTGLIFSRDEHLIVGDGGVIRLWCLIDGAYEQPRVLCRHDSGMKIQQKHPHPVISADGTTVVFTSDARTGYGDVFQVRLDKVDITKLPFANDSP